MIQKQKVITYTQEQIAEAVCDHVMKSGRFSGNFDVEVLVYILIHKETGAAHVQAEARVIECDHRPTDVV